MSSVSLDGVRMFVSSAASDGVVDAQTRVEFRQRGARVLGRYADALAANPWIFRWPLLLANVRPAMDGARWFLLDDANRGLPLRAGFTDSLQLWRLISAHDGGVATVVVEWDGTSALPISVFGQTRRDYLDLAPGWAA